MEYETTWGAEEDGRAGAGQQEDGPTQIFLGASNGQDIGNSGGEVQGMLEGKYGECISQHRHEF